MSATRALLLLLAVISGAIGAFAFVAPHAFYLHVLGVDKLGPYDQHLVSDVGGFYLGFALLFGFAARGLEPPLVRAACAAFLLTQVLHFGYHLFHLDRFTFAEGVAQTVELGLLVLVPAVVLWLARDRRR